MISIKLLWNFIEIILRHGCSSVKLLHIFETLFYKNTYGRLLLKHFKPFCLVFNNCVANKLCFESILTHPMAYSMQGHPTLIDILNKYRLISFILRDQCHHIGKNVFKPLRVSFSQKISITYAWQGLKCAFATKIP